MTRDLISFDWKVCEAGYEWVHVDESGTAHWRRPPETWPSDSPIGPYGGSNVVYMGHSRAGPPYFLAAIDKWRERPISPIKENPNLFLEFASLSEKPDDILGFANKWGLLGEPVRPLPHAILQRRFDAKPAIHLLEPVSEWLFAIGSIRSLVAIFSKVNDEDWYDRLGFLNSQLVASLNVKLEYDAESRDPTLKLLPKSLSAAMYLQIASAITEHAGYRDCVVCKKWFEISRSYAARSDKIYCSDACRMRAYRIRCREASRT